MKTKTEVLILEEKRWRFDIPRNLIKNGHVSDIAYYDIIKDEIEGTYSVGFMCYAAYEERNYYGHWDEKYPTKKAALADLEKHIKENTKVNKSFNHFNSGIGSQKCNKCKDEIIRSQGQDYVNWVWTTAAFIKKHNKKCWRNK